MAIFVQQPQNAIIVDPGSFQLRVGLAIDPAPMTLLPATGVKDNILIDGQALGDALQPFLQQNDRHPVVLSLSRQTQARQIISLCESLFNSAEVVCIHPQEQANTYYCGRHSAVIVDIGYQSTRICGLYEGMYSQISKLSWDQSLLDLQLKQIFSTNSDAEILQYKRKYFFSPENALQYRQLSETSSLFKRSVTLPDGRSVELNTNRFELYELPQAVSTIVQQHADEVQSCHMRRNEQFAVDVVLVGGGSLLAGLPEALLAQLMAGRVLAAQDRANATWLGSAVWTSLYNLNQVGIRKQDLAELGERVVEQKVWI